MATAHAAACHKRCLSFLFCLGFSAFLLWLTLRVDQPKCYIKQFYLPALNKSFHTRNHVNSNLVSFTLELENGNKDKGIRYDNVNLSFSIVDSSTPHKSLFSIGNATIAGFYQGKEKDALKNSSFQAHGVNWTSVFNGGKVVFRVDLATALKYKILFWFTERHGLVRKANVEVNDSGLMVYPKGVRMQSDALKGGRGCCVLAVVGISLHVLHLIYLHS